MLKASNEVMFQVGPAQKFIATPESIDNNVSNPDFGLASVDRGIGTRHFFQLEMLTTIGRLRTCPLASLRDACKRTGP
jgi:hypothetical protein